MLHINYEHNLDGAGDEELGRFASELRRQYDDDMAELVADLNTISEAGECARYDQAVDAAEQCAFADWSRRPESVVFTVEAG